MAKYSAIKAAVNAYIKQNGRKEITGKILNAVLNATIDSLGKFYQFAGEALPTDDPGTPDQNLTYLAGTAGTYTNFGGLTLDTQEIALLMWDGEWKKQTLLFGIQEVDASVDNQVGTPSVDVDFENNVLTLSFHNIKGDKGDTGDPAGFGQVTASVDDTIGNPSVQVQTSGEDTAKNIAFEFHGLRGETGITSVVVSVDNTTGNPACSVSLVGQVLHLDFTGLKGLKGDTGVSADYPITIYNGLDSDATDQALAAAQGKVLDGKISQLGQKVDVLLGDEVHNYIDSDNYQISSSNQYINVLPPNTGRFYNIIGGMHYKITAQANKGTIIAVLQSIDNVVPYSTPDFCDDFQGRIVVAAGTSYEFDCPVDGHYLYMIDQPTSSTYDVGTIISLGIPERLTSVEGAIGELEAGVSTLTKKSNDISLVVETTTYNKQQVQETFEYTANQLWDAANSLGKTIPQVTKANATPPAYVFKIPINGETKITYPVFKTTSGYGCLVADSQEAVIAQYSNNTLATGTLVTITTPKNAAYFYFSAPSSISNLQDYTLVIAAAKINTNKIDNLLVAGRVNWLPLLSSINTESNDSLCLAAIKTRIIDNKIPFHSGFLFHKLPGDDGKVYFGTKLDNAVEVATLDYTPKDYVLAVSPEDGTIIGVVRDNRLPIRVYHNGQNYTVDAKSSDNNVSPKGWLYNSGVEFIKVNGTEYCIFAEYDGSTSNNQVLHIWKGTYPYTSPSDWKTVLSKTTSYNPVANGTITHFHMIRRDPWTGILYCTTGDFTGQFFWLYSTDNGETWNTLATDFDDESKPSWALDGQPLRCINFIFMEDYIYFATDHGSNNTLSRIQRDSGTGVIDITTREILASLPYGIAVNTLCYVESPHGLFMFTRIDTGFTSIYSKPVPVLFWSFKNEQLYTVASLKQLTQSWGGHRGKCYMNYTNGQESRPAMGFAGNTPCQFDLVGANGTNIGTIFYDL